MSLQVSDPFVSISDKSYFELGEQDIKEMWENDSISMTFEENNEHEDPWSTHSECEDSSSDVVLHDRMISDSVLPGLHNKHEHSYSLANHKYRLFDPVAAGSMMEEDDMEKECFPAISMNCEDDSKESQIMEKEESPTRCDSPEIQIPKEEKLMKLNVGAQSLLKHPAVYFASSRNSHSTKMLLSRANVKMELFNIRHAYSLPPTPPSSCTSDCEGNQSPIHAPNSPDDRSISRNFSSRTLFNIYGSNSNYLTRQPISTPLISSQPRGATGNLVLTEEEKRTLIAEGYPIPAKLPLSKAEERSLKKIRRKIKNKISAQESRRKKKEYMDHLERKVELLVSENMEYRKQLSHLEAANSALQHQLQELYADHKKSLKKLYDAGNF